MITLFSNRRPVLVGLVSLLSALLSLYKRPIETISEPAFEYDFIVVGAGAAGSVVASRLATESGGSVLLVEAGGRPSRHSQIPIAALILPRTEMDWSFLTEPQEDALYGFENRQYRYPQGRALGGSTTINSMLHNWPSVHDMDNWARVTRDDKFRFANFVNHIRKIENATSVENKSPDRGLDGPVSVSSLPCSESIFCRGYMEAIRFNNLPIRDINSRAPYGFMPRQATIRNGQRWSAVDAFLLPTLENPKSNLEILTNALAEKVEIKNGRAGAVRLRLENGRIVSVRARREIVIAGGALNTPKILMLSGIGPRRHLEEMGIPVVQDLPVGDNLLNHVSTLLYYRLGNWAPPPSANMNPTVWITYLLNRSGQLANNGHLITGRLPRPSGRTGDIQYTLQTIRSFPADLVKYFTNYKLENIRRFLPDGGNMTESYSSIAVMLQHPASRGTVRLRSADPLDLPRIDPRYLSNEDDVSTLLEGARFIHDLTNSPSLWQLGVEIHLPDIPECRPPDVASDQWTPTLDSDYYSRCWIRYLLRPNHHPVGTCKMGQSDDPGAVVDTRFRVLGIGGLRVVDASVFPVHVAANTQGAVYAVADLAADVILQDNSF